MRSKVRFTILAAALLLVIISAAAAFVTVSQLNLQRARDSKFTLVERESMASIASSSGDRREVAWIFGLKPNFQAPSEEAYERVTQERAAREAARKRITWTVVFGVLSIVSMAVSMACAAWSLSPRRAHLENAESLRRNAKLLRLGLLVMTLGAVCLVTVAVLVYVRQPGPL